MRKTYHLSLSSHEEVLFRCREDYIRGFNCFAEAVLETESRALADAEMSTHVHFGVQTDNYKHLMYISRYAYSRYFNNKYLRKGRLGEKDYFILEINGIRHITAALSYVFRQGLHHGLSETPFGYEHNSCNAIFQKQLGKSPTTEFMPEKSRYRFLSGNVANYAGYRMNANGLLLREDIIDTAYVEEIFLTPRNFLFNMTRMSDEKWLAEQKEEGPAAPVTLDIIEKGMPDFDPGLLKFNEKGRVDHTPVNDMDLCLMIDREYVPKYLKDNGNRTPSIYMLPETKRKEIGNAIWEDTKTARYSPKGSNGRVTVKQLERCLALNTSK